MQIKKTYSPVWLEALQMLTMQTNKETCCKCSQYNQIKNFICSAYLCLVEEKEEELFICHIHNYTEYTQQWNLFSAFNPSKSAHTWSSGQPTMRCPRSSWGFGALLKGLTSVVDNSCWSQDSNPQPRVTSPTLYPLGHDCPLLCCEYLQCVSLFGCVESMCSACVVVKLMKLFS